MSPMGVYKLFQRATDEHMFVLRSEVPLVELTCTQDGTAISRERRMAVGFREGGDASLGNILIVGHWILNIEY